MDFNLAMSFLKQNFFCKYLYIYLAFLELEAEREERFDTIGEETVLFFSSFFFAFISRLW